MKNKNKLKITCITAESIKTPEFTIFGWNFPSAVMVGSSKVIYCWQSDKVAIRQDKWTINWPPTDAATDLQKTLLGGFDDERFWRGLACKSIKVENWVWM